ncbi:MAG: heavy-metal-associated domain-containing protein [Bacteroidales bacterium]|nr:heavy-metal-associated domain-containing protein [Bacteroidales bacterium]
MKSLRIFLTLLFAVILGVTTSAQTHDHSSMTMASSKTETFKVFGKCDMCKARIEKTVKAEGATENVWDVKTQMLTVTFDPSKTNKDAISKKLAAVGHDTEKYKATNEAYANLPGCCHYDRAK